MFFTPSTIHNIYNFRFMWAYFITSKLKTGKIVRARKGKGGVVLGVDELYGLDKYARRRYNPLLFFTSVWISWVFPFVWGVTSTTGQ